VNPNAADILKTVGIFTDTPAGLIEQLAARSSVISLSSGDWLFREGEPSDRMFVVLAGRLDVIQQSPTGPRTLRLILPGEAVGEVGVLTGASRSASVQARRDSELLCTDQHEIEKLYDEIPGFAMAMVKAVASHLRPEPSTTKPTAYAVLVDEDLPSDEIRRLLLETLGHYCRVGVLEPFPERSRTNGIRLAEGENELDVTSLGRQLDRLEGLNDLTLMFAPLVGLDSWWRFCLRQADSVLVIASTQTSPSPELRVITQARIAFAGNPDTEVVGRWLDLEFVKGHHHLGDEAQWPEGLGRLARSMLGRSVGLVLSGGGARGLAHIGVLEVLEKAGIAVDRVGGCSMGAFVAALFAVGTTPAEMLDVCRRELVLAKPFFDYTSPRASVLRARKADLMLRRVFGEKTLEATRLPCFTVSCDLVSANVVVHRTGLIHRAVAASASIPGIVPPVLSEDQILVDGGLLDNLPVDQMSDEEGPIIAVDVAGDRWRPRTVAWEARPGAPGLRAYLALLVGRGPERVPALAETLTRATVIGSWRVAVENRARADVVITPAVEDTGILDFRRFDSIVEIGRTATQESLEAVRKLVTPRR
jgi:NTE family protein